jgi:hypothetical protein
MKKLLLSALSILAAGLMFAQSTIKVIDSNGNDISGTTLHVWADSNSATIEAPVDVMYTGTSGYIMAHAKRKVNYTIAGSNNYFCWTYCYAPPVSQSPQPDSLYSGIPYTKFHGYFAPNGKSGAASITYTFFQATDSTNSAEITIIYHSDVTGIGNVAVTGENKIAPASPNPANSSTVINYSLKSNVQDGKLVVYNMLGTLVKEVKLEEQQGTVRLNVAELTAGVYFYSLVADNKVITTRKLVVSH